MIGEYKIAALCLAKVQDEACRKLVKALNEGLVPMGWRLFVYSTANDMFWNTQSDIGEKYVFDLIDFDVIDTLIYYDERVKSKEIKRKLIEKAHDNGIPVFVVDGECEGCVNVNFDYSGGFELVVRHVVEHHKKTRVHYLGGMRNNEFSDARGRVVEKVMHEHGYSFGPEDISYGDFWAEPANRAIKRLIDEHRVPEAVICANDAMAMAISVTLMENGYKVPEDVLVTGFDGIDGIMFCNPRITSCVCSYDDMGRRIIEIMSDERPFDEKVGDYLVMPTLLPSESCGCVSRHHVEAAEYIERVNMKFDRYQNENRVLNQIGARIQTCNSVLTLARELQNVYFYDMSILLKNEVLDESVNPMDVVKHERYGKDFTVVLNTFAPEDALPEEFDRKNVVPNIDWIFEKNVPLIFTAIHFLHIPLGYTCFFYVGYDEQNYNKIFQLTNTLNTSIGGFRNIRFQKYLQGKIEDSYKLDKLTGFYNRMGFFREYDNLIERLKKTRGKLTVALADLDNLKYINDNFGHSEGDRAICAVANAMRRTCEGAIFCRFGGDEMLAVMETTDDEAVIRERLNMHMEEFNRRGNTPYPFSASLGVYMTDDLENMDFEKLLVRADELMYAEKKKKKSRRGEI